LKLIDGFPVLTITGPRQSGKTTLARHLFPSLRYFNFENPDTRRFAPQDPRGFFSGLPEGAILDEFQQVPELVSVMVKFIRPFN
jgi:predicted AAA+ superfamily ATPase